MYGSVLLHCRQEACEPCQACFVSGGDLGAVGESRCALVRFAPNVDSFVGFNDKLNTDLCGALRSVAAFVVAVT